MDTNLGHASKCILASKCSLAGGERCNAHCASYIAMHGFNGKGGRAGSADMPSDYRYVTVANSPARESQAAVYKSVDRYVATFSRQFEEDGAQIKSVYLYSDSPGTGKTTTAAAILHEWLVMHYVGSAKRGLAAHPNPAYFLDVNLMQTEYNLATMTKDEDGMARLQAKIARSMKTPFLVMDDIGVRSATEAFRSYIHAIINHRATNAIPTVYTSNLELDEMVDVFDERLYDRMRDMCLQIDFIGTSKRGKR